MKHAYLIIAHGNWLQLQTLISMLDSSGNDIYIHIDAKVKDWPKDEIASAAKSSKIEIFSEYKVYWGSYEIVEAEMLLFREASKVYHDYYHLLSGTDLPIKGQAEIDRFFEEHNGCEFIHFDTDYRLKTDHEIQRRTKIYHLLQNYRRRFKFKPVNQLFTFLDRALIALQIVLRIDRMKAHQNLQIKYGSQWVSITDELVKYILTQEALIHDVFCKTNCADELFIQTLVYNSYFKNRLFNKKYDDDIHANMRLIDMKNRGCNGSPYTWQYKDIEEIRSSDCLFARKFDCNVDNSVIIELVEYVAKRNARFTSVGNGLV